MNELSEDRRRERKQEPTKAVHDGRLDISGASPPFDRTGDPGDSALPSQAEAAEKPGRSKHDDFGEIPRSLQNRFIVTEKRFYFRDRDNELAFEIKGKRLVTDKDDPHVAKAMVELAEAKGWQAIQLKGSDVFKREAWLEASLRGMETKGYKPRDIDLAVLHERSTESERLAQKFANQPVEAGHRKHDEQRDRDDSKEPRKVQHLNDHQQTAIEALQSIMRSRGDSEKAVSMAGQLLAERFQQNRLYVGRVIEHGSAPYENDPKNEPSHYVKLRTEKGDRIVWGVDLQRSMEANQIKTNDEIVLANMGRKPVAVTVKVFDNDGKQIGTRNITAKRNTWEAKRLDLLRDEIRGKVEGEAKFEGRRPVVKVYDRTAPAARQQQPVSRDQNTQKKREMER